LLKKHCRFVEIVGSYPIATEIASESAVEATQNK
jgi:hypothetical protein